MSEVIKTVSKYKNNSIASGKKHVFSRLLDYFLVFILTYFVFVITHAVVSYFPFKEKINNHYYDSSAEVYEYIDTTHLQRLKADKSGLETIESDGQNYLINLTKTSAYYHDLEYSYHNEDNTYTNKAVTLEETFFYQASDYPLDNLAYYFKKFKLSEPGLEYETGTDINNYLYVQVMELDASNFIDSSEAKYQEYKDFVSTFVIMNKATTEMMIARVAKGEEINSKAVDLYNKLYKGYVLAVQKGIDEVENHSDRYLELIDTFNKAYNSLIVSIAVVYYISYLISYIIYILISKLIAKEWITVGHKVMKLSLNDNEEMEVTFWRMALYHLLSFILFSTSSLISFMLFGMFGVTSLQVIPHISLLAIMLFVLTFNVVSILFTIFDKKHHHDLSTYVARIYVKDINEFDTPVTDVVEENNDGK